MLGKQKDAVPEMRDRDDCWHIHRLAKLEEETFGAVFSAGVTTHLEYCKKYQPFIPESACTHPSDERMVYPRLDGSAVVVCRLCGDSGDVKNYLKG